jgi:hypothetical protein
VFATAVIGAGQSHTWQPVTVVCDHLYVTLGTNPAHPSVLYALAKDEGLYSFNPAAIPLVPGPPTGNFLFFATGLFTISADGKWGYAAASTPGPDPQFEHILRLDLNAVINPPKLFAVTGIDDKNDILADGEILYLTDETLGIKHIRKVDYAAAPPGQLWDSVVTHDTTRLALLSGHNALLVSFAGECKVSRLEAGTGAPDLTYRIPAQIFPVGMAGSPDESEVYILNFLSNTLSIVDAPVVITAGAPPAFTTEPPVTLSAYRTQIIDAYTDLLLHLAQYVKDGLCDQFLVDCENCRIRPEVYLGVVEIEANKVKHICNFTERHYVKSFRTYGYWLSAVPVLPLFKRAWKEFCCKII